VSANKQAIASIIWDEMELMGSFLSRIKNGKNDLFSICTDENFAVAMFYQFLYLLFVPTHQRSGRFYSAQIWHNQALN
jgi:hypothetical protein